MHAAAAAAGDDGVDGYASYSTDDIGCGNHLNRHHSVYWTDSLIRTIFVNNAVFAIASDRNSSRRWPGSAAAYASYRSDRPYHCCPNSQSADVRNSEILDNNIKMLIFDRYEVKMNKKKWTLHTFGLKSVFTSSH